MKQCNVPFPGREGWCYPMDSQWKKSCREAIPLLKGWPTELAEAFVKMCEALFSGHSLQIFTVLSLHRELFFRKGQEWLHGNKTEELSITIKGPFVSFVLHNNGKLLFLGWRNGDSRCRDGELTDLTKWGFLEDSYSLMLRVWLWLSPYLYSFVLARFGPESPLSCKWIDLALGFDISQTFYCLLKKIIEERIWVLEESLKAKVRISVLATEIMKCIWLFQSDLHITFWMERSNAVYWQIVSF